MSQKDIAKENNVILVNAFICQFCSAMYERSLVIQLYFGKYFRS